MKNLQKFLVRNLTTSTNAPLNEEKFKRDIKKAIDFLIIKESIIPYSMIYEKTVGIIVVTD